jgi:copper transport protein
MVRRLFVSALVAVAALLVLPGVAGAHALLKSSIPAAGADLKQAPHQLLLTFTEPPDPTLSLVTLVTSSGATVDTGKAKAVPGAPTELQLSVPQIPNGVYTVNWRTVSKTDGHVTGGSFAFGISTVPSSSTSSTTVSASPSPTAPALVSRWLLFVGLALMVGGAAVRTIVRLTPSQRGVRILLLGGLAIAAVGLIGSFVEEAHAIGATLPALAKTSTGRPDEFLGAAIILLAVIAVALNRRDTRGLWLALGAAGILAMLMHAIGSHADNPSRWRWFNLGVEWAHLVGVGIWIGGLVWLFVAIRGGVDDDPTRREGIVRFSKMAAVALAVVAASGLGRALNELNGLHSVWSTSFGKTLLVKVALFGVLLTFGALNHYRLVPKIRAGGTGTGTLARSVRVEMAVAAATIFAAVLLSQLPPASYASTSTGPPASAIVVTGSDFGTTVRLQLQISPGVLGSNTFDAQVVDYDTGAPVSVRSLVLNFTLPSNPDIGGSSLSLKRSGSYWKGTGTNLSVTGTWSIAAVVQEQTGAVSIPLKVKPKLPPEQISTIAGNPTLYTITLGGGLTVQTYVDPDTAGVANVHFTFFQSSGKEQPIASASATQTDPVGTTSGMKLIRFDPGHFAANTRLTPGTWTFTIQAKTTTGVPLTAYFTQPIS